MEDRTGWYFGSGELVCDLATSWTLNLTTSWTQGLKDVTIALDDLKRELQGVYDYCMDNLGQYLDAVSAAGAHSIRTPELFLAILEEAAERYDAELRDLVAHSTESCRIEDLESLPNNTWPALAEHQRFPATLANIYLYLSQREEFDEHLQSALRGLDDFLNVGEAQYDPSWLTLVRSAV